MLSLFLYHYFVAHGIQYCIHFFLHYRTCPHIIAREHKLHHAMPQKITWYGNPTVEKDIIGIYSIAFTLYVFHIFIFYENLFIHFVVFTIISMSFLTFHGLCHYLSKDFQQKIPILNVFFFHHYKHHIIRIKNFGFGDLTYDFLFGTLDLDPLDLNKKEIESIDKKYFRSHN